MTREVPRGAARGRRRGTIASPRVSPPPMRVALSLAAWADDHARREPRARVALLLTALVSLIAWWKFSDLAESAYWGAVRLPHNRYPWIETPGATAVCLRLLAGFAPVAVVNGILLRRVAGARAATAAWVSLTTLGAVCVAPAFAEFGFASPVERVHGARSWFASSWIWWWGDRFQTLWSFGPVHGAMSTLSSPTRFLVMWATLALGLVAVTALVVKSSRRLGPRVDVLARHAANGYVALSVAALIASGAMLLTRPRPADYVSPLPVIATLPSEQELLASRRLSPALPMMRVGDEWNLSDHAPSVEPGWAELDHHVGALAVRSACWLVNLDWPMNHCALYWREASWPRWVRVVAEPIVDFQPHERIEVRHDPRTRTAFLTVGPRVIAGLHLDAMPTRADWELQHPERWFVRPARAWVALSQLPVAPDRAIVALALAGLLTTILLRASDRPLPSRDEVPRGYRDAATPPTYNTARVDAWLRDDALERSWRALALLSLTHAPLVAWFATRL